MPADPFGDLRTAHGREITGQRYEPRDRPQGVGTAAQRPVAADVPRNSFYYASDTGTSSFSDGTTWTDLGDNPRAGTAASKPAAAAGNSGWFYYETDTNSLWYSNGSAWVSVSSGYTTSAYRNTNQSLTNATWNQIALDNETRDDLGWHSNSTNNHRITPTLAGVYSVSARVVTASMTGSGTTEFRISVYNSGGSGLDTYMAYDADLNNLNRIFSVSGIYPNLAVGDFFVAEYQPGATGSSGNVTVCNLNVTLLRTP